MGACLRVVSVGPAAIDVLVVQHLVYGLDDDFFQVGDGGNVHLLAEGVGLAQGVGGYGVVIADLVSLGHQGNDGILHALDVYKRQPL